MFPERTMRAVNLKIPYLCVLFTLLGCGEDVPVEKMNSGEGVGAAQVAAAAASDDYENARRPVSSQSTSTIRRDLLLEGHRAYVGRDGVVLGPAYPAWNQISQLTGRGPWSPVRTIEKKTGSFLKGHGATIGFPVGTEGPGLRTLSIWLWPARKGQFVSVYLDEKLLGTPRLKSGWHRYDFALPASGIALGEHSVRLWFRKLGKVGSRVTPGALGCIELSKKPGEFSEVWMTSDSDPCMACRPAH